MTLSTPSHLESQILYMLMTWLHGPLLNTPPHPHVMQETINRVRSWADEWFMEVNYSKTQAILVSFSTVKEKVVLKLEDMPVPQADNPAFLGVTLDTHLTWKTRLEVVAARSVRKLGLLKKLAGTAWGADTSILRTVYTGAVIPIMEYATTSWATASNANKSKHDNVQNVTLRAIVGAMKTTPIKEMEKRADLEPLELQRTFRVLTQTEKTRRLPGHPLHKKLAAPTKNRLKRQSLNHLARDLRRTQEDILDPQINERNNLCSRGWNQDDLRATIFLEVPGLLPAEQQIPTQQMALTLEMLENICRLIGHICTLTGQQKRLSEMEAVACLPGPQQDKHLATLNAIGRKCSNFKAETSALQNVVAYIAEMKPQKTVILTDSKAALQSLTSNTPDQPIHQLLKDLQFLPHECTVVLQWILAHCGIPGNERADHLAKSGSKQLQHMSTSTYQEAKTLLWNRQKCQLMEKSQWRLHPLNWPNQPSGKTWVSHYIQVANRTLWPASAPEANWHHGLCTQWLQRSRTDGPPHPPGLSHLAETETPVWPQDESTTNKLWGMAKDLRRTTQFLATCGLRV